MLQDLQVINKLSNFQFFKFQIECYTLGEKLTNDS